MGKQLLLPVVGTVGGIGMILTGQGAGWAVLVIAAALFVLWGLRRYRGIVL